MTTLDCNELSRELVVRRLDCARSDVVYVKSIVTAYDGLCAMFSDGGSSICLVSPRGREAELDQLVEDLVHEISHSWQQQHEQEI